MGRTGFRFAAVVLMLFSTSLGCGESGHDGIETPEAGVIELRCHVDLSLTDETPFATLDAMVDYAGAPGRFAGDGPEVECRQLVPSVSFGAVNHCDQDGCPERSERWLTLSINAGSREIAGPLRVARCAFAARERPTASGFRVEVVDAADAFVQPLTSPPGVAITDIACVPAGVVTTTSSTSTSTIPCDDASCPRGEHCVAGRCEPVDRYDVELFVDASGDLGAIQVKVAYDCARGGFVGFRDTTECVANPALPVAASFNDDEAAEGACGADGGILRGGIYTLSAIPAPVALFTCTFAARGGVVPHEEDFAITVEDAAQPDLTPFTPWPAVRVSAVRRR